MTAQITDSIQFDNNQYDVIGYSPSSPFKPHNFGYNPVAESTACYRGYMCEYSLKNELFLQGLIINHQSGNVPIAKKIQPPDLNFVKAERIINSPIGIWRFSEINMLIPFTGGLIIGKDCIESWFDQRDFYKVFHYSKVLEIIIASGKVQSVADISIGAKMLQEKLISLNSDMHNEYMKSALMTMMKNYIFL